MTRKEEESRREGGGGEKQSRGSGRRAAGANWSENSLLARLRKTHVGGQCHQSEREASFSPDAYSSSSRPMRFNRNHGSVADLNEHEASQESLQEGAVNHEGSFSGLHFREE